MVLTLYRIFCFCFQMCNRLPEIYKNGDAGIFPVYYSLKCRWHFSFFLFFFHLTYSRWTSSLPSCLWSQRIFPSLPGSRLTIFLSRCKFSTLTTRQPMVEFYLLTFPRFSLQKNANPTLVRIELTTSVLADVQLTY